MLKQFQNHIARHRLCKATDKILLAISGGLDSMAMLNLFCKAGYFITVAHCNFQLRGNESDEDEKFVEEQCSHLKVKFHSTRFDTNNYAWENGLSIQIAARELRYAWFDELLIREKLNKLATAHHLNDSLETVLLNLCRGTGIEGMAGIPLENKSIIRPMLFASREEIKAYAASEKILWREDSSNFTDDYQRNFIRHQIIPKLKEINPSLEHTFLSTLEKVRGGVELMHLSQNQLEKDFLLAKDENIHINKNAFQTYLHPASVLWEVIKRFGFNIEQCEDIIQSLHGQPGKKFLSLSHQLVIDRESLIVAELQESWDQVEIQSNLLQADLGPWRLDIQKVEPVIKSIKTEATVDFKKLQFPLVWRKWKAGDLFCPLGMEHHKKVSDFLIDQKISLADKDSVTVLESNSQIVWVVGHRVDDRFKITPRTEQAITFKVSLKANN